MRMQKRKFRIGELAKKLEVKHFVIRFWEKEFQLKSYRSTGGQRFYDEDDLNTFALIKTLLYEEGFTIAGAKQQLKEFKQKGFQVKASSRAANMENETDNAAHSKLKIMEKREKELNEKIILLEKQLIKLRQLL